MVSTRHLKLPQAMTSVRKLPEDDAMHPSLNGIQYVIFPEDRGVSMLFITVISFVQGVFANYPRCTRFIALHSH